jgi:hypothetical protein
LDHNLDLDWANRRLFSASAQVVTRRGSLVPHPSVIDPTSRKRNRAPLGSLATPALFFFLRKATPALSQRDTGSLSYRNLWLRHSTHLKPKITADTSPGISVALTDKPCKKLQQIHGPALLADAEEPRAGPS